MPDFDILKHHLVPKHTVLSAEETAEVMEKFNITKDQLPKIFVTDPIIREIGGKPGEVVKVERNSNTAGYSIAYRLIISK